MELEIASHCERDASKFFFSFLHMSNITHCILRNVFKHVRNTNDSGSNDWSLFYFQPLNDLPRDATNRRDLVCEVNRCVAVAVVTAVGTVKAYRKI